MVGVVDVLIVVVVVDVLEVVVVDFVFADGDGLVLVPTSSPFVSFSTLDQS